MFLAWYLSRCSARSRSRSRAGSSRTRCPSCPRASEVVRSSRPSGSKGLVGHGRRKADTRAPKAALPLAPPSRPLDLRRPGPYHPPYTHTTLPLHKLPSSSMSLPILIDRPSSAPSSSTAAATTISNRAGGSFPPRPPAPANVVPDTAHQSSSSPASSSNGSWERWWLGSTLERAYESCSGFYAGSASAAAGAGLQAPAPASSRAAGGQQQSWTFERAPIRAFPSLLSLLLSPARALTVPPCSLPPAFAPPISVTRAAPRSLPTHPDDSRCPSPSSPTLNRRDRLAERGDGLSDAFRQHPRPGPAGARAETRVEPAQHRPERVL